MRKQIFGVILFALFLCIQPGFNVIEQYQIHAGEQQIIPTTVEIPTHTVLAVKKERVTQPTLTATSAIIIDKNSSAILFSKNPDQQLFPASVTKIMTALVAIDSYPLDKEITVTTEHEAIGSTMGLYQGEVITVQSLLKGLLIKSGNDAAYALANAYPGGYGEFVKKMNDKAQAFHLDHTVFTNVSGVEEDSHYTTVRDIAILTKEAMKIPFFKETVATKELVVTDVTGTLVHHLESTNQLLGSVEGVIGVKTGWTDLAGECLVTEVIRQNHDILIVLLNSKDRFGETKQLIDWVTQNYDWVEFTFASTQ